MDHTSTSGLEFSAATREFDLERAQRRVFDLIVIGGGITGAGVLLDAVSRGLTALLVEKNDFASGTSSRSSRLIHGGLRYLESLDLGVVSGSLRERSLLLQRAPHLVWATPFVIPLFRNTFFSRRRRLLRAGLALYDALGASLGSMHHRRANRSELQSLIPGIDHDLYDDGIVYWDAVNDDARTCISVLKTAVYYGGIALNHCEAIEASAKTTGVQIKACDKLTGFEPTFRARALVNATGVFAGDLAQRLGLGIRLALAPARGAHLVLRKPAYPGRAAVLLPVETDRRFLFVIPVEGSVVVGTTDGPHEGNFEDPKPEIADVRYISEWFDRWSVRDIEACDVSGAYAGLRPLVAQDGPAHTSDISRRHVTVVGAKRSVTVTGGKFTAYRRMAEEAVDLVGSAVFHEPTAPSRTHRISLAGSCSYGWFRRMALENASAIPEQELRTLWRRYGSEGLRVLRYQAEVAGDHGPPRRRYWCFEGEVINAIRHEAAASLEDIIFRRVRLGSDDFDAAVALAPIASAIATSEAPSVFGSGEDAVTRLNEYVKSMRELLTQAIR